MARPLPSGRTRRQSRRVANPDGTAHGARKERNMEDKSIGIFYAVKWCGNVDRAIQEFMQEYGNTEYEYNRDEIDMIIRMAIMDYISNCYNPLKEMRRYFETWKEPYIRNEFDIMRTFIYNTTVRDNGQYVSGFKENPFKEYKVFAGLGH